MIEYVPLAHLRAGLPEPGARTKFNADSWGLILDRFGLVAPIVALKNDAARVPESAGWQVVSDPGLVVLLDELRKVGVPPPSGIRAQLLDWLIPVWVVDGDPELLSIIAAGGVDRALLTRYRDPVLIEMLLRLAEASFDHIPLFGMDVAEFDELLELLSADASEPLPVSVAPIVPDAWGIPMLDLSMQADALKLPLVKWGTVARSTPIEGTYHFYTSDRKFRALAVQPDRLPTLCHAAVEINFSTAAKMPRALALHTIYRKRFVARRWQAAGLRVWVDLNVDRAFDDLALLGVPRGWQAYANRGYSTDLKHLSEAYERACAHADGREVFYLVYGGGQGARRLCADRGWIWAQDYADRARGRDGSET